MLCPKPMEIYTIELRDRDTKDWLLLLGACHHVLVDKQLYCRFTTCQCENGVVVKCNEDELKLIEDICRDSGIKIAIS